MPRRTTAPPTPSPSNGQSDTASLYSTPVNRRPSPDPSSASTVRGGGAHRTPRRAQETEAAAEFLNLLSCAQQHTHAFRVHSPERAPHSTLLWTGQSASSGFFPYNEHHAIPPSVYLKVFGNLDVNDPGWECGPYARHTMVDHINGKMRQGLVNIPSRLEERPGTPEDEKSPWISGTRSLMWAIWEVARRLAWGEDVVGLAVIKCGHDDSSAGNDQFEDDKGLSELQKWNRADARKKRGWIGKEFLYSPLRPIAGAIGMARAGDMSVSMKEAYECALRAARESEEVLWYARVFAESIERNIEFSAEQLPLDLPAQFWLARRSSPSRQGPAPSSTNPAVKGKTHWTETKGKEGDKTLQGWLSRLVWDPREDEYDRAVQKVVDRRRQLCISRGVPREQCPLNPI